MMVKIMVILATVTLEETRKALAAIVLEIIVNTAVIDMMEEVVDKTRMIMDIHKTMAVVMIMETMIVLIIMMIIMDNTVDLLISLRGHIKVTETIIMTMIATIEDIKL